MANKMETLDLKEVLMLARENDERATRYLINRYKSMINTIINTEQYFLRSGDRDDLISEGLIGLTRAFKDFDESKGNAGNFQKNLENFLYMCISRSLISAIKTSNRLKHSPLNDMVSFDRPLQDNENLTAMDLFAARPEILQATSLEFMNAEEKLILEESVDRYKEMLNKELSESERDVYTLRLQKYSYKEIQEILGLDKAKKIDNALQRVKTKLMQIIEQEERKAQNFD
ncbi:sigma-70 family RNA polymerase sigma factor [Bacillus toyonensis]|uniref:sigma-70 family RNA polymerase sigma factor n=1 Tax=Bacillus toyonensis TaxID=155322 RepID=UPI002E1F62C0|nr:sigma-70 family RNA polymerase sigma factor [Bacillus toyonensis]